MREEFPKLKYSYIIILFLVLSCSKPEILDDVVMNQAFSLPLGERTMKVGAPSSPTSISGLYGTFWYNGYPYQLNVLYFQKEERLDFKLDSVSKLKWIQRVDFLVKAKNSYPVNSYLQIYLLNSLGIVTDSVFTEGIQKINAGEVNSLNEVQDSVVTDLPQSSFVEERLANLKTTKYLSYKMHVSTKREDGALLKFTHFSNIKVNMAMRLFLRYNLNEI